MAKNNPSYEQLLIENRRLLSENESLRRRLDSLGIDDNAAVENAGAITPSDVMPVVPSGQLSFPSSVPQKTSPQIHMRSAPEEKIALFRSLFAGRADVYAHSYLNKRTGKPGYAPTCGNEWIKGVCGKPKVKCARCPNRDLMPLTDKAVYSHLSGKDPAMRDIVGMYPMLPDETCRFLVADFDGGGWQADALAFRAVCSEQGLPVAVERSRSGNGAHVWFFFQEPVACARARRLASTLLTLSMEQRHEIGFASYDRLLPNQDTMPAGGFGNLIALPLQGAARAQGNSVFVDECFMPYPDQWAFLSAMRCISSSEVDMFLQKLAPAGELGQLAETEPEAAARPWERKAKPLPLAAPDFPREIIVTRANGLYIPKQGLSERALNRITRLAAFKNPDYYRAQAMRLPTYNKPRVICGAAETGGYLCLPRGLEAELLFLLEEAHAPYRIEDKTEAGRPVRVTFEGTLREDQQCAAQALLADSNGVLSATTAFGKTVVAAWLIGQRKTNTLILVHTQALMNQWKAALEGFLVIDEKLPDPPKTKGRQRERSLIGRLGGGKSNLAGIIDIAIIPSLIQDSEVKDLVKNYGMVIVDECHHVSSVTFEAVLRQANARFVYGLSATPARQDGHHPIIFQQCGPVRYIVDAKTQAEKRGFAHSVLPRFTRFRKPLSVSGDEWPIAEIYTALAESQSRNSLILKDVSLALEQGRTPLILTNRVVHAEILADQLQRQNPDTSIFLLCGKGTAKEKRGLLEQLNSTPNATSLAIIATGKYIGEGFDEPRLDTLFLASPIAWKGTLSQYAGRLHRDYAGKEEVVIYDYIDIHVPVLERMYQKRLVGYALLGYEVIATSGEEDMRAGAIYNQDSFLSTFSHDLTHATQEAIVISPYLSKGRVTQMKKLFFLAMAGGAKVTVLTRPAESFGADSRQKYAPLIDDMLEADIQVIQRDNIHQKMAIIDRKIVWYGSINLLSYGRSEESMMRFDNNEIAEELLLQLDE